MLRPYALLHHLGEKTARYVRHDGWWILAGFTSLLTVHARTIMAWNPGIVLLSRLQQAVIACTLCPRLVEYRQRVAPQI